jgi:hypothetical protein
LFVVVVVVVMGDCGRGFSKVRERGRRSRESGTKTDAVSELAKRKKEKNSPMALAYDLNTRTARAKRLASAFTGPPRRAGTTRRDAGAEAERCRSGVVDSSGVPFFFSFGLFRRRMTLVGELKRIAPWSATQPRCIVAVGGEK